MIHDYGGVLLTRGTPVFFVLPNHGLLSMEKPRVNKSPCLGVIPITNGFYSP